MKEIFDDKFWVTMSVLSIAIYAMATFPEGTAENIVTAVVSGLFGLAVGRKLP